MSNAKESTALVPFEQRYGELTISAEYQELIRQNMEGEDIRSHAILDQVKVPTGGSLTWLVPSLDGDQACKELIGIIIHKQSARRLWDAKGKPPSCQADGDCTTGVGTPGGECKTCPFNQFGSAVGDDGKARGGKKCKEIRQLFVLLPGREMPVHIAAPPGSLKNVGMFFQDLTFKQKLPYWGVIVSLGLEAAQNDTGDKYAKIKPQVVEILEKEQAAKIVRFKTGLMAVFQATDVEQEDLEPASEGVTQGAF